MVVKIIVDPMASAITPSPTPMAPILSKDSRVAIAAPVARTASRAPYAGPTYSVNDTTCNLEAMANIQQSIFESQRNINHRLLSLSAAKPSVNSENNEKIQKTSAKKLTEALSQVKEIRFDLDDNETIPMKSNVKSHTTTPANTPFDVSPPKSPEPTASVPSFSQLEAREKHIESEEKLKEGINEEEKAGHENGNESDGESLDVLSLSSGNESSDEFVLVPFPTCFDLNVPFVVDDKDVNTDSSENNSNIKTETKFEMVENGAEGGEPSESDDDNTLQTEERPHEINDILSQPNEEIALDLTTEKSQNTDDNVCAQTHPKQAENQTPTQTNPSLDSEPQVRSRIPKPSTNPFANNTNETENVIHVLPESIVTGALSAAAHVYNNVSRALFSRNEVLLGRFAKQTFHHCLSLGQ